MKRLRGRSTRTSSVAGNFGQRNASDASQADRPANFNGCRRRFGFTFSELIICSALLVVAATFITTLSIQINFVWRDIYHHRLALEELSNEIDRLTRLSPVEVESQLDGIKVRPLISNTLRGAKISGKLIEDELGTRLTLQFDWQRRYPGKPMELSGWLLEKTKKSGGSNEED